MKNTVRFFLVFILSAFLIFINVKIYSQTPWSQPIRLTNGFVDKNPAFGTKNYVGGGVGLFGWEFLVFERHINPISQICVKKIDLNPSDSVIYLTSNSSLKRNPAIAYDHATGFPTTINNSLVLWESNENSKWDIFGRYYNSTSGWGNPFPFDTTAGNKYKPHLINMNGNMFAIVYEKNGDIIFRQFNAQTQSVTYDTNLTATDTSYCSNADITISNNTNQFYVTYQKKKPDNKNAVYIRRATLPVWSSPDTIAYAGDNTNDGFCINFSMYIASIFESDRTGNNNIYATTINPYSGALQQEVVINNPGYNNKNFVLVFFPIITDYIPYQAAGYVRRGNDSVKIKLSDYTGQYNDSVTVGDTSKQIYISMNLGIFTNWLCTIYVVYYKDSASYTQLWTKKRLINLGAIRRLGTSVPDRYSLSQNYPNPFNAETKIKFDIPSGFPLGAYGNDKVVLKVFDLLGREVAALVNESLQPGTYEVTFDGSNFSSGIYFYQLSTNNFVQTKKIILLK